MASKASESLRLGLKAHLAKTLSLDSEAFRLEYGRESGFVCTAALARLCTAEALTAACPPNWQAQETHGFVIFQPTVPVLEKALQELSASLPATYAYPQDALAYSRITRLTAILPRCPENATLSPALSPLAWAILDDSPAVFPLFEQAFRLAYPPRFVVKAIIFQILQKNACIFDRLGVE